MDRRDFIKLLSAAGVGLNLGRCGSENSVPLGTNTWGSPSGSQFDLLLPQSRRPQGVFEMYLMGGLTPWDTFYVAPEYGHPNDSNFPRQQWWTFQDGEESVPEFFELCDGGTRDLYQPYAVDSNGVNVCLGPWVYPFRDRPDILKRMRVMVMSHPFEPHQVASPLMLCGHPRGSPRMTAPGAHAFRYFQEMEGRTSNVPYSYVLYSEDTEVAAEFDVHAASSNGRHPAYARPLVVRLLDSDKNPLPDQLARLHLNGHADNVDAAVAHYLERYQQGLYGANAEMALSTRAISEFVEARRNVAFSDELAGILTPDKLARIGGQECHDPLTGDPFTNSFDSTAMGVKLAAHLINHPQHAARYVTYIDTGIINATGAGYDTHDTHVRESSRNVVHATRSIADSINKPGENDPAKFDLDKHQILLTTEFGRTPYEEIYRIRGLNHWPFGYVVVAIGGFVGEEQAGLAGAIGPDGVATEYITPAMFRSGIMLSMGVWPFASESFAIGDIPMAATEEEAAAFIRSQVLGYKG